MAPNNLVNKLQPSNGIVNPELTSNSGSATSTETNTGPSALHPDPAAGESRDVDNTSTRLLNGSHTEYSAVGVTVPANGVTIPPEHDDENENRTTEPRSFWQWYTKMVVIFRMSFYGQIFGYWLMTSLFMMTSVAAVFGFPNRDFCPQAPFLPIFVSVVGAVGFIFAMTSILMAFNRHMGDRWTRPKKLVIGILFGMFLILTSLEIAFVSRLHPSFDPIAEDYCAKALYYFLVFKEAYVPSAMTILALIYFPGSIFQSWCQNCFYSVRTFFHRS